MIFRSIVVFCALALPMTNAVINTKSEQKIERREAPLLTNQPFDTYGPPKQQTIVLPTPVYGAPAVANYPPPPPERPPPPPKEYGVPVLQYGPPKVHVEYGVPPPQPQHSHQPPPAHSHQQIQTNHHSHHQVIDHNENGLSFFEQIKQTFGFGGNSGPSTSYGPPSPQPHHSYGPPPSPPVHHFSPPKVHTKYGVPPKPHFVSKPPSVYGPPPSKPHTSYGPPKQQYLPSIKPAISFKPPSIYGPPPPPKPQYHVPQQSYGPPAPIRPPISQQYGPPSLGPPSIAQQYEPPQHQHQQHQQQQQLGPSFHHGAGCDGWKPIPGPSLGTQQALAHSNGASIQSSLPENSYLPPVSNNIPLADTSSHLQVQPLPTNLQLPFSEPTNFNNDAQLGASLASGLGLTTINVVKSEGIELQGNFLDSYSAPPAESFAPGYHKPAPQALSPPSFAPAPNFAPQNSFPHKFQSHSPYPSQHFSKQYPPSPRHPIPFRQPVPQGLFESIGQSVQHQDTFGVKLHPQQQQQIYLPPPTNEIPPPPPGLESLPLAPAAPFNSQAPKANLYDQFVYTPSQCSHGPNLAGGSGIPQFHSIPQFQHLQTVSAQYGVPAQPLDVSPSSSFEIASQNANAVLDIYGPPASGAVSTSNSYISAQGASLDSFSNTHESPSSSYGPPPSGNPADFHADSFAHGSMHNSTTTSTTYPNHNETNVDELPGLGTAGLDIISAQKSVNIEVPVQGQFGTYSLQFQAADPLASQNNELDTPDDQKLLSEGLLQSILSAIEKPKQQNEESQQPPQPPQTEDLENHPAVNEFVNSAVGQETLGEVKAE